MGHVYFFEPARKTALELELQPVQMLVLLDWFEETVICRPGELGMPPVKLETL